MRAISSGCGRLISSLAPFPHALAMRCSIALFKIKQHRSPSWRLLHFALVTFVFFSLFIIWQPTSQHSHSIECPAVHQKMEQFDQLLTCAICLDRYRNPKLLPCQHSFCMEPCMEGLINYVTRQVHHQFIWLSSILFGLFCLLFSNFLNELRKRFN